MSLCSFVLSFVRASVPRFWNEQEVKTGTEKDNLYEDFQGEVMMIYSYIFHLQDIFGEKDLHISPKEYSSVSPRNTCLFV